MPFGEGPAKALEYALNLANSFGLRTKNLENYAGWAEWGEGDEMIGILVHLDVVPEGSGWTYPPYMAVKSMIIKYMAGVLLTIKDLLWRHCLH
jgi:succinyl-diaminopimelate desuccinylase